MYAENCGDCGALGTYGTTAPPQNGGSNWAWVPDAAGWVWAQAGGSGGSYVPSGCYYDYIRPYTEGACSGTPSYEAIQRAVMAAPQADIEHIINDLLNHNNGEGPKSRDELSDPTCIAFWAKAFMGGRDCINSALPQNVPWFKSWVETYGGVAPPADKPPTGWIPTGAPAATSGAAIAIAAGLALVFVPKILGR